jgi:outer membrane protein assembly factor BamD
MKYLSLLVVLLLLASCTGFNRVLKSDDYEEKRTFANDYFNVGDWSRSIALYEQIYQRYSQGPIGEEAYFRMGKGYFNCF